MFPAVWELSLHLQKRKVTCFMPSRMSYALNIQIPINILNADLRKYFLGIRTMPSFVLCPEWSDCCQTAPAFPMSSRWVTSSYQTRHYFKDYLILLCVDFILTHFIFIKMNPKLHLLHISFFKKFNFFCVCMVFCLNVYLCIMYIPCSCLVPLEARRGYQDLWNWSFSWLWTVL